MIRDANFLATSVPEEERRKDGPAVDESNVSIDFLLPSLETLVVKDRNIKRSASPVIEEAVDIQIDQEVYKTPPLPRREATLRKLLLQSKGDFNLGFLGELPTQTEKEVLDKYEFLEILGEGATGHVKRGINKRTSEYVAIKTIALEKLKLNKTITREVNILRTLNHPGIVCLKDVIATQSNLYIVMELASGKPLFDSILDEHNYNEEKAREIIKEILEALKYLHEQGIAHRDIKPENVVYESDLANAQIKLVDFGVANISSNNQGFRTPTVGTLGYKAPEIFRREEYDKSIDMWSVGVLTYIMLSGFPPFFSRQEYKQNQDLLTNAPFWYFFNDNTEFLKQEILEGKLDFPEPFWSKISPEARDFVSRLLQVNPVERLTAEQALDHKWIKEGPTKVEPLATTVTLLRLGKEYANMRNVYRRSLPEFKRRPSKESVSASASPSSSPDTTVTPPLDTSPKPPTHGTLLLRKLRVRPTLQELVFEKVIETDNIDKLFGEKEGSGTNIQKRLTG